MKTEEFREIKPLMDADERRWKSKIAPLYLRSSASICGLKNLNLTVSGGTREPLLWRISIPTNTTKEQAFGRLWCGSWQVSLGGAADFLSAENAIHGSGEQRSLGKRRMP